MLNNLIVEIVRNFKVIGINLDETHTQIYYQLSTQIYILNTLKNVARYWNIVTMLENKKTSPK